MEHNLNDWKETANFVDGVPFIDCSPLRWFNESGNPLSPEELINLGYWGVRPPVVPKEYNPQINKIEEVDLKDCERDDDKRIIIKSYKLKDLTKQELANLHRNKRNNLLEETDKFVYPDIWEDLPQERKNIIKSYRQALRDVPQQLEFPNDVDWPDRSELFIEEEINDIDLESYVPQKIDLINPEP